MASEKRQTDPENVTSHGSRSILVSGENKENNKLKTFKATTNALAHILIGFIVGINLFFAFSYGLPLSSTPMHIVLCVLGYEFLMAEGILIMLPENSWSVTLTIAQKRRLHWILQIAGSALAIAGSFVEILAKSNHWTSMHGIFGLVALVFTTVSLVNGLSSLYAYELRRILPAKLSKITHIVIGAGAFAAASICLCYGYDKGSFKNWGSPELSIILTVITALSTFIVIVNPIINMAAKYFTR